MTNILGCFAFAAGLIVGSCLSAATISGVSLAAITLFAAPIFAIIGASLSLHAKKKGDRGAEVGWALFALFSFGVFGGDLASTVATGIQNSLSRHTISLMR